MQLRKKVTHHRRLIRRVGCMAVLLVTSATAPLLAQSEYVLQWSSIVTPSSASSQLYFAHLADGGGWATSLFFSNPNQLLAATVNVSFYSDGGQPLQLDFGAGPITTLTLTVPAGGGQTVTSSGAGTTPANGWAYATSSIPLIGTLMYRAVLNGKPTWDVAAVATSPAYYYYSYATPQIGVAIANPSATQTIHLTVTSQDSKGNTAGSSALTLQPLAHTSFNLGQQLPSLPAAFTGSIVIATADTPVTPFVAYTLNVRDGLLAPLPPGELQSPAPNDRLLADAAAQVKASFAFWMPAAVTYGDFDDLTKAARFLTLVGNLTVKVSSGNALSASYQMTNGVLQINISRPLLETLASSKGAVAFLIAHYAIRAAIATYGNPSVVFRFDDAGASDLCALLTLFMAGMDPSSMVDFYARLQLANELAAGLPAGSGPSIDPALQTEFLLNGNYTARIAAVWMDVIQNGCAQGGQQACGLLHDLWHPSYPALIP